MKVVKMWIDAIKVGERLRKVDPEKVSALAESMRAIGLQQPISVWAEDEEGMEGIGYAYLVAGLHRLKAAEKLGWEQIDAVQVEFDEFDRRLWEIDENLMRADLTEIERARHLQERKKVWEERKAKLPEFLDRRKDKPRGIRAVSGGRGNTGFAADTEAKTGTPKRRTQEALRRAEKIDPEVREAIADTPAADKGVELDALASLTPDEQKHAVERVKTGADENYRAARDFIRGDDKERAEAENQKQVDRLMRAWKDASDDARTEFLSAISDWLQAA